MYLKVPAYLLIVTGMFIISDYSLFQESSLQGESGKSIHQRTGPEMTKWSVQSRENFPPEVTIRLASHDEVLTWNDQIRYEISVSDPEDGESRYGEIEPDEVLLEMEYLFGEEKAIEAENIKKLKGDREPEGLFLIKTSACFGCHRDKSSMTGPSFADIAHRYEPVTKTIEKLADSIIKGSSDKWGSNVMPQHNQITHEKAMQMATFILEQGGNKYRRIYPGLEGVIRIMEKPAGESPRAIVLTASYTDHGVTEDSLSRKRGSHSLVIKIR